MKPIVDLFAGPGGWSEGLNYLGYQDIGLELDHWACKTRYARGHATVQCDVTQVNTFDSWGLIASPPCPSFSMAGKGAGRLDFEPLLDFVSNWGVNGWSDPNEWHEWADARTPLVLEPLRWIEGNDMLEWIAFEQVTPVKRVWKAISDELSVKGWNTWTGTLNAANYGVPQTRQREFMLASRTKVVGCPVQTHAKKVGDSLFTEFIPWVSMADALGWGYEDRGSPTVTGGGVGGGGGPEPFGNGARKALGAYMLRSSALKNATVRRMDEPSPTVLGSWDNNDVKFWPYNAPATTVAGDPRITARCHHDDGSQGSNAKTVEQVRAGEYDGTQPIKLNIRDAMVLQSFPADYPIQGNKTQSFLQVGNAVPPLLAMHVLKEVMP